MNAHFKDRFDAWVKVLTLLGSAIAVVFTILSWNRDTDIKRANFLEEKIKEFEDSSTFIARRILDGYGCCTDCNDSLQSIADREMISIGSSREGHPSDITLKNLEEVLCENLPGINISNQKIRQSFDRLLDFFGKLEYYIDLDLLTPKEATYFYYYIERCAKNDAIKAYAGKYGFNLFLSLMKRFRFST